MRIKVKKLDKEARLPEYAHPGDAGMDIFSLEDYELKPKERHLFSTGVSIALPRGYVALIWDKSGLAAKYGLSTLGGVIDADYRGEYKIVILNTSDKSYNIKKGDKIAQVIIQPVVKAETEEVEDLDQTGRGSGSFGSTGK